MVSPEIKRMTRKQVVAGIRRCAKVARVFGSVQRVRNDAGGYDDVFPLTGDEILEPGDLVKYGTDGVAWTVVSVASVGSTHRKGTYAASLKFRRSKDCCLFRRAMNDATGTEVAR